MFKKAILGLLALIIVAGAAWWFTVGQPMYNIYAMNAPHTTPEEYALQDDSKVTIPDFEPGEPKPYNALKNVYWGELHVHTVESFDAVLFGVSRTIEEAYRFSRGEPLRSDGGELMQISRPLDFVAITDHAESFGTRRRCDDDGLSFTEMYTCWLVSTPNVLTFTFIRGGASGNEVVRDPNLPAGVFEPRSRQHPRRTALPICNDEYGGEARCIEEAKLDWKDYVALANQYNDPGNFTTFSAYEFSPGLPDSGKHHRNVIFNGDDLPDYAISSLDVPNIIELWKGLDASCEGDCDYITIPHNMNKTWGLFYSRYTWDGQEFTEEGWRLREKRERLAEMYQVKGASECAFGVGATDEECNFGQILKPCRKDQESGCAFQTSFARQGLKIGLQLEKELGFNPLAFGQVAATDTHNANPGDAEEWDFVGKVGAVSSPATRRQRYNAEKPYNSTLGHHTSGGLAAVWAEENTRDSIFAGMKRKETYATSGTRIALRFFAGWGFGGEVVGDVDAIAKVSAGGVPMGGNLTARDTSPTFFVWTEADLMSAPLQRVQMIKGWIDADGATHEKVVDIACSDGLAVDPVTDRCPDNGARVNMADCSAIGDTGAAELSASWRDPDYDPSQNAFYYVRVLQNPTCHWTTYDAMRLGRGLDPRVPATIRERAWSSPIWIGPKG